MCVFAAGHSPETCACRTWSARSAPDGRQLDGDAGASADALRAEWWAQPATNQTAEPRTAATDGGAAGPMLDPHGLLDNLWGGRPSGKLTEVGSGEYDVPQVLLIEVHVGANDPKHTKRQNLIFYFYS